MIEERPVDRYEVRWVEDEPTYQVHFWKRLNAPDPPLRPMWLQDSYRLTGVAGVQEAHEWAQARADGRDIAIYAELDRGDQHGLVRLMGFDPTWAG